MAPRLVLVVSPFTGAGAWSPVAAALPDAVAADHGGVKGPDWYEGVAHRLALQADGRPWIGVLHSGAGGFAPSLARASRDLAGLVFADAILPHPGRSVLENAPAAFAQRLRDRTTDGRLAPWNEWFDQDPTLRMVLDPRARTAFVRDLPRTPFAFLEAVAPEAAGWERLPCGYLQLSRSYEATRARAEAMGWPAASARLHHLAMLSEPQQVAALLTALVRRMGF